MWQKPRLLLRIQSLEQSVQFYEQGLTLPIDRRGARALLVQLPAGTTLLLSVGAPGSPITAAELAHMDERWRELLPGKKFYAFLNDLAARAEHWGPLGATLTEEPTGRELVIPDPDGYLVALYEEKHLADEEILVLYGEGPTRLREAVAGLSEADLDLARAPGKWTIRQLVHHIADSDFGSAYRVRFGLAEPGRAYNGNGYSPDTWAEGLDYAGRPIEPSLALFEATRAHVLGLVRHLPGALDRGVNVNGQQAEIRRDLQLLAGHAHGHIGQILETRQVHAREPR